MLMLKNITLGVYLPGKSLLHRLQARTKLLILVWFAVWFVFASRKQWHFAPYIAAFLLVGVGIALSSLPIREIWRRIWLLLLFSFLGGIPTLFSTSADKQPLYAFGPFLASYGTYRMLLLAVCLVVAPIVASSWFPWFRSWWSHWWLRGLRVALHVSVVMALLMLWLLSGPPASRSLTTGPFIITYGGVWTVVVFFVTLLALYNLSLLLTMTTTPVGLIEGLTMLLAPLRRIGLPVDDFALMTLLALRFIPTLLEELEQLNKAQSARGADIAAGTLRERMQSLSMLFIPFLQSILRRAADLSTALDARGYEVDGRQTPLYETVLQRRDYLTFFVIILVTMGTLLL